MAIYNFPVRIIKSAKNVETLNTLTNANQRIIVPIADSTNIHQQIEDAPITKKYANN